MQFHADADVARGVVTGRVEHVASTQAAHFQTLDELVAFMSCVLSDSAVSRTADGPMIRARAALNDRRLVTA